jgi:hypothetical protein
MRPPSIDRESTIGASLLRMSGLAAPTASEAKISNAKAHAAGLSTIQDRHRHAPRHSDLRPRSDDTRITQAASLHQARARTPAGTMLVAQDYFMRMTGVLPERRSFKKKDSRTPRPTCDRI